MEPWLLLKVLALIAGFLVLMYLLYISIQKFNLNKITNKRLNIQEYRRLDHKNSLCLLKLDSNEFLVAISPAAITILPLNGSRE
jgi:flagellar biogenesis protein FliO